MSSVKAKMASSAGNVEAKTTEAAVVRRMVPSKLIKNKLRRQLLYRKDKLLKGKERKERKRKRTLRSQDLEEEAPPKQKPRTIENTRVPDATIVQADDTEVMQDEDEDEMAPYFRRLVVPKVLIISVTRPSRRTHLFMRELAWSLPSAEVRLRRSVDLKKIIPAAVARDYTDIIVVNQDRRAPDGLLLTHLPEGPTAHFKLTSFRPSKHIKGHGRLTITCNPEVVLNNFTTRVGHTIARMLAAMFPHSPQFGARRVATFHNQRDYVFFRQHRYVFRSASKVGLQELGPRFTLKLRSLQHGTFDSKTGEYIWIHNRKQMDTNRRKFHL